MAPSADGTPTKRPKDRADQILAAADRLFCERGFNSVSLDDIGNAVGITGPAIYRHFDSKDALLVVAADRGLDRLIARSHAAGPGTASPTDELHALVVRAVADQIDHDYCVAATTAQLRHLPLAAARPVLAKREALIRVWAGLVKTAYPTLQGPDPRAVAEAVLCTPALVSSGLAQSKPKLGRLLGTLLTDALTGLDTIPPGSPKRDRSSSGVLRASRGSARERILELALPLVRASGFSGIGIDELGTAAGVTGPALYRHFKNKRAILAAATARASEVLSASADQALRHADTATEGLNRLVEGYVEVTIFDTDLMAVYWGERRSLAEPDLPELLARERSYVDDWLGVLRDVRPDLSERDARATVYATFAMINSFWLGQAPADADRFRSWVTPMAVRGLTGSSPPAVGR